MKLEDATAKFLVQLEADGRSPHTIRQYARHLRLFAHWWRDVATCGEVSAIGHEDVAKFFVSTVANVGRRGAKRKASTMNILKASVRGFFSYAHRAGFVGDDSGRVLRRARCGRPQPRALSLTEQERFLAVLDAAETFEDRRDAVLFRLMLGTGIRLSSALALDVQDIDLDTEELRLRTMKGDREERVFMPAGVAAKLREHLGVRSEGPVFTNSRGRRLTHRHVQRRFSQWIEKTGITRTVSPHSLRHTFAMGLYQRTSDILLVKEALRHRSVASTLIYARASEKRLREAIA